MWHPCATNVLEGTGTRVRQCKLHMHGRWQQCRQQYTTTQHTARQYTWVKQHTTFSTTPRQYAHRVVVQHAVQAQNVGLTHAPLRAQRLGPAAQQYTLGVSLSNTLQSPWL